MSYCTGLHPHIRATDTVSAFSWISVFAVVPAVCAVLFLTPSKAALFFSLLIACVIHEAFLWKWAGKKTPRNRGSLVFYALIFLLLAPAGEPVKAAVVFLSSLFLSRTFAGGQGASFVHPVAAAIIFLKLLFQGPELSDGLDGGTRPLFWLVPALLIPGAFYMTARKIFRPQVPFLYLGAVFAGAFMFQIPLSVFSVSLWIVTGFFLITDFETTPLSASGHSAAAFTAGWITVFLMLEGMACAQACALSVLSTNILTPWLDAWTQPSVPRGFRKVAGHA